MARSKRKTLPKNFDEILRSGDLVAVQKVFDKSALDAYGGYRRQSAIGYSDAGEDVIRWLIAEGADLEAGDEKDATPLIAHAGAWNGKVALLLEIGADITARDRNGKTALHEAVPFHAQNVRVLLDAGADALARDDDGQTPLARGLQQCSTTTIEEMAEIADLFLTAGDVVDDGMRESVRRIAANFQDIREVFNEESLPRTDAALRRLYELFSVAPIIARERHDGTSPILLPEGGWVEQHSALFDFLVPAMGAATTAQGEAIRISGRVANEFDGNGGVNWGDDFRQMVDMLLVLLRRGIPLDDEDLVDAANRAARVRKARPREDDVAALARYAVVWVGRNPTPLPLGEVPYKR
ncbi:ankyrin repeat domain-containing protein [Microbacterium sp. A93]|uniref:ankyrin repeat domain-containing protein n=1 Tax=Microbacterium sp. A93 TaxID=3450716 RepID=UPI003F426B9C